jgi:hypothetical protein
MIKRFFLRLFILWNVPIIGWAADRTGVLDEDPRVRADLIRQIFDIRAQISGRQPILDTEQDRLMKLTNELTDNKTYGCHYDDPIKTLQVVVQGNKNAREDMGEFDKALAEPGGGGSPTALEFTLGGGLSFIVDPADKILGGSQYDVDRDFGANPISMGSIEYLRVKKMGISYDAERRCRQKFIISEECTWLVAEENTYFISAIKIIANGITIYDGQGLNWSFNRKRQIWDEVNLRNDENWTKLMMDKDCEKTN